MTMLIKQFKKFLKNNQKRRSSKTKPPQKKFFNNSRTNPTSSMEKSQNHECKGFKHIAAKCTNTLNKSQGKKAINIS